MNSFTSHSKPWIAAFLVLLGIEALIQLVWRPNPFDKTNFLQFSFASPETPQRLFMYHKFREFADSAPTIVQSGDSSGFYGVEPAVVMQHLPDSMTYLNMSCCANLGFRGYYNTLKFMVERNPSVKYLVLHFTPYTMPRAETWDGDGAALWGAADIRVFGDAVYQEFLSFWRILHLPSMAWRRQVTDYFYYLDGLFNEPDRPLLNNANYLNFLQIFKQSYGWMPESDIRVKLAATECDVPAPTFFDIKTLSRKTYLEEVLDAHSDLARAHNATLIVVFQPVACVLGTGEGSAQARAAIDRFKVANPDVEIPFPLIETWPSDMFSVPAHIKAEHTGLIGHRLGTALAQIVSRRNSEAAGTSHKP